MMLHGYELPLSRQDHIEIDREMMDLNERDDPVSNGRRATLIYVLEESVRVYRKTTIKAVKPMGQLLGGGHPSCRRPSLR